jgi:PAS domain S-box-containing protein
MTDEAARNAAAAAVREDAVLHEITRDLARAQDVPQLLGRIAELALAGGRADSAYLEQVDRANNEVEVIATAGAATAAIGTRVPYPGSLAEEVIERDEPEIVTAEEMARRPIAAVLAQECRGCTALAVPLISEREAVGALILFRGPEHPVFSVEEKAHVRVLGDMAALALRRVLLQEVLERNLRALDESERRFRLLVHSVKDYAIFMLDPQGRIASWNEGARYIKGYEPEEVLGRHFSIFYTEEDRQRDHPRHELAVALREGSYGEEGWRLRKDGRRFWASVLITAVRDDSGELLGFAKVTRDLTERHRVEQALRESRERYRVLYEDNPIIYLTAGADGRMVSVNRFGAEYLGYAPDELIGSPVLDIVHPDDRWLYEAKMAYCFAHPGEVQRLQFRKLRRDGTWIWARETARAVQNADGGMMLLIVCEDVTEVVHTLQREREANRKVATILESITDAFFALDREWRFTYLNRGAREAVRQLLHRDPEEAIGSVYWDVVPEFRGSRFEEEFRRAMTTQQPVHFTEYAPALGVWFEVHVYPSADGLSVYFRDASERKQAEEERARLLEREREARGEAERRAREEAALRQAAEAVSASFEIPEVIEQIAAGALTATNADGAFVERVCDGLDGVEIVAVAGERVPPCGQRRAFAGSYTQMVLERSEPVLVDPVAHAEWSLPPDLVRSCADCAVLVVPLLDAGEAIGALFLVRGAEKWSFRPDEVVRAHTFGNLAALAFRKVHLLEDSEQKREELEEVMESRVRLIRGFSHDVKNPLGAADGFLDLIESGVITDPEKRASSLTRARRAIRSALGLINDLVELARAEAGQIEITPEPVDVRSVATEMTEEYRAQAAAKGLALDCHMPDEFPLVESDASRLRQILGNLISNAVKYTPDGRIDVRVMSRARDGGSAAAECVAVDVSDTGMGIPEEKQHLLFREFTRLDPEATHGAGLGLAISRRVAQALRGDITFRSEPGRGSTFTLWLPLKGPS